LSKPYFKDKDGYVRKDTSSSRKSRGKPIYVNGKHVGRVVGDTFVKRCHEYHRLTKPPAWALDVSSLTEAESYGAKYVRIEEIESHLTFVAATSTIWERGRRFDRGYDAQIFLPIAEWQQGLTRQAPRQEQPALGR
jgi:hypothetical protein